MCANLAGQSRFWELGWFGKAKARIHFRLQDGMTPAEQLGGHIVWRLFCRRLLSEAPPEDNHDDFVFDNQAPVSIF
jgi:hypothetical protein